MARRAIFTSLSRCKEHAIFQRDGVHLFCRVPVTMPTAAMGGEVEVPTIDGGKSRVKVPAGSQTGKQMRLRAKGMPALRGGGLGDMLIELAVETPVNLTSRQKELLREFEKLSEDNNPEGTSFFLEGEKLLGRDEIGLRPLFRRESRR